MHPDKVAHRKEGQRTSSHLRFIELKNAWEDFDSIAKQHSSVSNNNKQHQSTEAETLDEEGCFTTFGVGCSFADSEEEKDLRNEFMEQACRGWLSSGSLAHGESSNASKRESGVNTTLLSEDDMFIRSEKEKEEGSDEQGMQLANRKCLVQNVEKFKRR